MKKHSLKLSLFILTAVSIGSCKKEGLKIYSASDSIFFENYDQFHYSIDSTIATFAYDNSSVTDKLVQIKVKVTGSPVGQDRPFKIVADPSSTAVAGQHYENLPGTFLLPGGKVEDTIVIKLLRTDDLKQNAVKLVLIIKPNESFTTDIKSVGLGQDQKPISSIGYKILFSDILIQPAGWSYYFGKFSPKKMAIICDLAGVTPVWLNEGSPDEPISSIAFDNKTYYYAQLLKAYLVEMKYAGTPVLYEDGTEMRTDD